MNSGCSLSFNVYLGSKIIFPSLLITPHFPDFSIPAKPYLLTSVTLSYLKSTTVLPSLSTNPQ